MEPPGPGVQARASSTGDYISQSRGVESWQLDLADVGRGRVQCAAGFVTKDDTAVREALEAFVSELESGDAIRVHRGLLLDLDVVTAHLKQL